MQTKQLDLATLAAGIASGGVKVVPSVQSITVPALHDGGFYARFTLRLIDGDEEIATLPVWKYAAWTFDDSRLTPWEFEVSESDDIGSGAPVHWHDEDVTIIGGDNADRIVIAVGDLPDDEDDEAALAIEEAFTAAYDSVEVQDAPDAEIIAALKSGPAAWRLELRGGRASVSVFTGRHAGSLVGCIDIWADDEPGVADLTQMITDSLWFDVSEWMAKVFHLGDEADSDDFKAFLECSLSAVLKRWGWLAITPQLSAVGNAIKDALAGG